MFLGFILATSAIRTGQKSTTAVAILTPILALGLPILDTTLAVARRAVRGRPLFSADKEHIHHRLMTRGLSHRQAAIALYGACIVLNCVAIALIYANSTQTAVALGLIAIVTFVVVHQLGYIQFNALHYLSDQRRRNRMLRSRIREIREELRVCRNEDDVWDAIKHFASDVDASFISLSRRLPGGGKWRTRELGSDGHREHLAFASAFDIQGASASEARLEIAWCDGRTEIDRDHEIALESLVGLIAETYARFSPSELRSTLRTKASALIGRGLGIEAPRIRNALPHAARPRRSRHGRRRRTSGERSIARRG
jgi:UDP-GlcNAc:undecaprenyl-phosphate GlcNAc-1-phosphate transferase